MFYRRDAEGHGVVVVYVDKMYFWGIFCFITYQMLITSTTNVFCFFVENESEYCN